VDRASRTAPRGPVVIDYSVNEVFTPTRPPAAQPVYSARAAWDTYNRNRRAIPRGVIAQYGTLTLPITARNNPIRRYEYRRQPVWAYSSAGGCDAGYGPSPLPVPSNQVCITWTFLDPGDASELDSTQQSFQTADGKP
jgi:hypothetical protein